MARRTKSQNTKANTVTCPICEKAIVDSGRKGQDSTFCEGSCQAWLHRCCSGLTRTRFDELNDDNASFHCPSCEEEKKKQTKELADLKSVVAALAQEVMQLKESLASVTAAQANPSRNVKENLCCRYEPPQRQHQQPTQYANILKPLRYLNTSNLRQPVVSLSYLPCPRFEVVGARRIWVTVRLSLLKCYCLCLQDRQRGSCETQSEGKLCH